jgi:hypothetical protein
MKEAAEDAYKKQPDNVLYTVRYELYTVKKGENIATILREGYGLKDEVSYFKYLELIKTLNPEVEDVYSLSSSQEIRIPKDLIAQKEKSLIDNKKTVSVTPTRLDYELYTIKEGEYIFTILRDVCGIQDEASLSKYLALIRDLNPEIEDLSKVSPGQEIRIPKDLIAQKTEIKKEVPLPIKEVKKVEAPKKIEAPLVKAGTDDLKKGVTKVKTKEAPLAEKEIQKIEVPKKTESPIVKVVAGDLKKDITNSVIPAFIEMGATAKKGIFSIPISGGGTLSINTQEVPVIEFDSSRCAIVDVDGKISSQEGLLVTKQFSRYRVINAQGKNLETVIDDLLKTAGYFSINKDESPILIGDVEKAKFYGKWVVYKTDSLKEVFVINMLQEKDRKTPEPIKKYASHFGVSLIDIGGIKKEPLLPDKDYMKELNHSYKALLDSLGVAYKPDSEIHLYSTAAVDVTYKAPLLVGNVILSEVSPDKSMIDLLEKSHKQLIDTTKTSPKEVLKGVYVDAEGPPIKMEIFKGRVDLELPGMKVGSKLILEKKINSDWSRYLNAEGFEVLVW